MFEGITQPLKPLIDRPRLTLCAKPSSRVGLLLWAMTLLGAMSSTTWGQATPPIPAPPPTTATKSQPVKLLLDGTEYANKPAQLATAKGVPFKRVLVNGYWLTKIVQNNAKREQDVQSTETLQESGTRFLAHWTQTQGASYLLVDLEGPMLTPANCEKVLACLRAEKVPNLKISFYEVPHAVAPRPNSAEVLRMRHEENAQWAAFAAKLDFLTPSLYSGPSVGKPSDMDDWIAAMNWSVAECHSVAPGVPVLPVLCPRFVDYKDYPKDIVWTMIPTKSLSQQIAETLKVADGYLMWDPAYDMTKPDSAAQKYSWTMATQSWWPAVREN